MTGGGVIPEPLQTVIPEIFYRGSRPFFVFNIFSYLGVTELAILPHLHIWRVCFTYSAEGRNMELLLVFWIPAFAGIKKYLNH